MEATAGVFSLLVIVVTYAGLAKVAAHLYRRSQLSWRSAFGFGALIALVFIVGGVLVGALPGAAKIIAGFALAVAVGAWFLGSRATDANGQALGLKGASVLSAIIVGIAFGLGIVLAVVLPSIAQR